mmetsp:Transcript_128322/g.256295  ORF Transcript_128322/g.256295 Transcript_128322/m.256295 type:complete len:217 (+) Transcript_128322:55-705(+)
MSKGEEKFNTGLFVHRTACDDHLQAAKNEFGGNTNFSAYRQARDPQFLGVNGKNYYAKPWGNDSSNVQAVLNGPGYWKRICHRENMAARFHREDMAAAASKAKPSSMPRSSSDSALRRLPDEPPDGYAKIKESMSSFAERDGKPKLRKMATGERLHFFNTLEHKYHVKGGARDLSWNVSKDTHRSSPSEMRWILSNYFRTDTPAVLDGKGTEPEPS